MDIKPSDVGLQGNPKHPIRGFCLDDRETAGRKRLIANESLPIVNPMIPPFLLFNLGHSEAQSDLSLLLIVPQALYLKNVH